jgi:hypothetical protein
MWTALYLSFGLSGLTRNAEDKKQPLPQISVGVLSLPLFVSVPVIERGALSVIKESRATTVEALLI